MVCGWDKGYFGLQELGNGKKLLIFSVWDSEQNDPKAVEEDRRTKLIYKDEKVRIGRFGGEGTGGQSFFDYDWKVGETYRLMVTSKVERRTGPNTRATSSTRKRQEWKHLVTFSTVDRGKDLGGYYSFIEDFKRDRVSTTRPARPDSATAWSGPRTANSIALTRARFTADANPVTNINAGVGRRPVLPRTGGKTKNTGPKLREIMTLPDEPERSSRRPPTPRGGGR